MAIKLLIEKKKIYYLVLKKKRYNCEIGLSLNYWKCFRYKFFNFI